MIRLSENKKEYKFTFKGHGNSFRSTTNSFMFQFNELYGKIIEKFQLESQWTFFKLKKSDYIYWLDNQYYGMLSNKWGIQHFVFVTEDAIIEILSDEYQLVEI